MAIISIKPIVSSGTDPAKLSKRVTQYIPDCCANRSEMIKATKHVTPETQKQGSVCKSRPETNKKDVSFGVEKAELNFKNQVTSQCLIRPIFRKYIQVFKWDHHSLNGAKLT